MAITNFNYNNAISQANQVDNIAKEMLAVANRQLQTTMDSIGACWRGEASQQFLGHCATTQADIRDQAKKLQDLARRIREVARIIEAAEERAKELQRKKDAAAASKNSDGDGKGGGFSGGGGTTGGRGLGGGGRRF